MYSQYFFTKLQLFFSPGPRFLRVINFLRHEQTWLWPGDGNNLVPVKFELPAPINWIGTDNIQLSN